jgi:hypothetical protein
MKEFVVKLLSNDNLGAKDFLDKTIRGLVDEKLNQIKMRLAMEIYEDVGVEVDFVEEKLDEGVFNVTKMGRTKIIRVRIRKGKIQRRVKKSTVKGYTIRGGKMVRMMPAERRHRQLANRRSKFKRRAKMKQSLRKRRISLRKRGALGL